MKTRRILAAALALFTLALTACETTTPPPASDSSPASSDSAPAAATETPGEPAPMKIFTEKLDAFRKDGAADPAQAGELLALFDALPFAEKCAVPYADFQLLTEAEYKAVHAEALQGIDSRRQDIVAAVARAFYDQSAQSRVDSGALPQTQYDQNNSRYHFNVAPEDATEENVLYLACSAYANSVYHYAFGANLLSTSVSTSSIDTHFAAKTPDKDSELMFYITGTELAGLKADDAMAAAKIAEIQAALQPGDLINYTRSTGVGHIVLYVGNRQILHSTGSSNAKTSDGKTDERTSIEKGTADELRFGTINLDHWDRFFTKTVTALSQNDGRTNTGNNYLFADNVTAIAVFRPLNAKDGALRNKKPTDGAVAHYLYPGIDVEKTAAVTRGGQTKPLYSSNSVFAGDTVTYTTRIRNRSDKPMPALTAVETLPLTYDYVSSCDGSAYFAADGVVAMHVGTLAAGESVEFSYTLRPKEGTQGGKMLKDNLTFVNGIQTNTLCNQFCAVALNAEAFAAALNDVTGKEFANGGAAAAAVYTKAGSFAGIDEKSTAKTLYTAYLSSGVLQTGAKNAGMVLRTLYGGYKVGSTELSAANKSLDYTAMNNRVRRIRETSLEDGDLILSYSAFRNHYEGTLYFRGALYGIRTDGTFGKLNPAELSVGAGGTVQDYLDTLTGYSGFLILRPALIG